MPYCNTCRTEYHEGVTRCPDCGESLRPGRLPEVVSDMVDESAETEPVVLCRLADGAEVQVVCAALREAGLPFYVQTFGPISGNFTYTTDGVAPEDLTTLRVPRQRFAEAEQILTALRTAPIQWPAGMEPEG